MCCSTVNCRRDEYCSFSAPDDAVGLKYGSCPFETSYCGENYELVANTTQQSIKPVGSFDNAFRGGALCRYVITFPEGADENALIQVNVVAATDVEVYLTESLDYVSTIYNETIMLENQLYNVSHPAKAYITTASNVDSSLSLFAISYKYVIASEEEAEAIRDAKVICK